jgi:hypothetical protein
VTYVEGVWTTEICPKVSETENVSRMHFKSHVNPRLQHKGKGKVVPMLN